MKLQLEVLEMTCSSCVSNITRAIRTVDAKAKVQGDLQTKIVLVETKSPEAEIKEALAQAGYPAS
jgi:copper chaperone